MDGVESSARQKAEGYGLGWGQVTQCSSEEGTECIGLGRGEQSANGRQHSRIGDKGQRRVEQGAEFRVQKRRGEDTRQQQIRCEKVWDNRGQRKGRGAGRWQRVKRRGGRQTAGHRGQRTDGRA